MRRITMRRITMRRITMRNNAMHRTLVRIFYEDTDCGGVVYYANYLRYFERARTLALLDRGVDPGEWMKRDVLFTVYRAEVDYKGPAQYGDTLVIETEITEIRGPRIYFGYTAVVEADGAVVAKGVTKMACVNELMKPRRIPDEILEKLK